MQKLLLKIVEIAEQKMLIWMEDNHASTECELTIRKSFGEIREAVKLCALENNALSVEAVEKILRSDRAESDRRSRIR